MFISVIICTCNRCKSLRDTLDSILIQQFDEIDSFNFEVIVVDNNSKDRTREVVENFMVKFNSRLKYLFEPRQGKSYALNRAIKEASGEIIAFTDDDVIVDSRWLSNIVKMFKNNECDGLGGRIELMWLSEKPYWLSEKLYGRLGKLDYGNLSFRINSKKYPIFGGNAAFKKSLFIKFGYYNELLGRKGNKLYSSEDTEVFFRFYKNAASLFFQPNILVYHKVPSDRLIKNYFRKWHFHAANSAVLSDSNSDVKKIFFCIPRYMVREFIENAFSFLIYTIKNNSKEAFRCECRIIFLASFFINKILLFKKHYAKN